MIKKILVIISLFLFISCSNVNIQNKFSTIQKENLIELNSNIKEKLSENNFSYLKSNIKDSIKNRYILNTIENIDFTNFNIFISKPIFDKNNRPKSILGLNSYESTFYFEIIYIFDNDNDRWLIYELRERE